MQTITFIMSIGALLMSIAVAISLISNKNKR